MNEIAEIAWVALAWAAAALNVALCAHLFYRQRRAEQLEQRWREIFSREGGNHDKA
jgi:hypothetical protein